MKKLLPYLLCLLLFSTQHAHADAGNYWLIVTTRNETFMASRMDRILDNELFYTGSPSGSVVVDSVMRVTHVRYPNYARNISIGTAAGAFLGLLIGIIAAPPEDPNAFFSGWTTLGYAAEGAFIGLITGAATGAAISFANHKSKTYVLANMNSDEKRATLKRLCVQR